jgi:hypothetical protein
MKPTTINELVQSGAFLPEMEYDIGYGEDLDGFFEQLAAIKLGLTD